jgi:ABC-type uncharacterized transport system permease subunit
MIQFILEIVDVAFVTALLAASVRVATPILFSALGEAVAESAGVLNIAVEGMMALGALGGFLAAYQSESVWIGFLGAFLTGVVAGLVFGFVTIERSADQVVTGIVMNILCFGLASLVYQAMFSAAKEIPQVITPPPYRIPWLSDIAVLGRGLFSHSPIVYIAFGLVPVFWFILRRTTWGLKVRAVGESPAAAESAGIDVWRVRFVAIMLGGATAAVGGAVLSIVQIGGYLDNMTAGRGFIAIAVVVFGGWNPWRIGGVSLLFGGAEALQLRLQAIGAPVPHELLLATPYLLTIVAISLTAGKANYPGAINVPYPRHRAAGSTPSPVTPNT